MAVATILSPALAQQPQGPREEVAAFSLTHRQAADVEHVVRQMLSGSGMQAQVVRDPNANRLIVHGSEESLRLVADMLRSIDRPVETPQPAPKAEPVLHAYRLPRENLKAASEGLRAEFGRDPSVRVAVDDNGSQLLILAPPEAHRVIGQRLAQNPPQIPAAQDTTPYIAQGQPQRNVAPQQAPQMLALRNVSSRDAETRLRMLFGVRMTALQSNAPNITAWRVTSSRGAPVVVEFDHRANGVRIEGAPAAAGAAMKLIAAIDSTWTDDRATRVLPVSESDPARIRRAVHAIQTSNESPMPQGSVRRPIDASGLVLASRLFQNANQEDDAQPQQQQQQPDQPRRRPPRDADAPLPDEEMPEIDGDDGALLGPVRIEYLEDLDQIIIEGSQRDVERVERLIADIERLAAETVPSIQVYRLEHVGSQALAEVLVELNQQVLAPRQGSVSITALVKPNALLLIGREESVATLSNLIKELDQPVDPTTQFKTFRLRYASAANVAETIEQFYEDRNGLESEVKVTADTRSNSVVVQASPRDLLEIAAMVEQLDTNSSAAMNELRVIRLQNTLAEELAPIIQAAINAQATGAAPGEGDRGRAAEAAKSLMLSFMTVDEQGQRRLNSGILSDVTITPDARANTLIISAPAESMDLLEALVRQLDQQPAATALVKVFTIENGDATALADLIRTLFGQATTQTDGGPAGQTGPATVVPLRLSVDTRTNSIIASGTEGELLVVEAILRTLDTGDVRDRKSTVYRLQNAPAILVSNAINEFLASQRDVQQSTTALSPFEQLEREVVVVPEEVSNSLIVSATPRFYAEIERIVRELDARPPKVLIQVLIGEVALNNTDEFGVELGLQDSVLFDRSLLTNIQTTQTSTSTSTPAGVVTQTQEIIQAADLSPGFAFAVPTAGLGNSGSAQSLATREDLAGQGITTFGVGRVNSELGFGGLVLSASSESVSLLIRALRESRRLEVLSRPQIMTLDNQPAYIQVGQRVPRITSTQIVETGTINSTVLENVGLILEVQPRVSPDGMVSMLINAEKSALGPEAEGIPISINANGDVIRSPRIDLTLAQTTVSALDGQTVILGGLITKSKSNVSRRVPMLSEIPVLGNLFRYDSVASRRTELLIIMTPHIVRSEADAERVKQIEAARMSWCLADVRRIHGEPGIRDPGADITDNGTVVIYPDRDPRGELVAPDTFEPIPAPQNGMPSQATPPYGEPAQGQAPPSQLRLAPPNNDAVPRP